MKKNLIDLVKGEKIVSSEYLINFSSEKDAYEYMHLEYPHDYFHHIEWKESGWYILNVDKTSGVVWLVSLDTRIGQIKSRIQTLINSVTELEEFSLNERDIKNDE